MSAEVAYTPPPVPEPPKHFATMLIGIVLVVVGAILINQGMSAMTSSRLVAGAGLLAAGALLVLAGASRVWPGKPTLNISLLIAGILLLVSSGTQLSENWSQAAYAIVLVLVGIALIAIGIQVARQSWKKYVER